MADYCWLNWSFRFDSGFKHDYTTIVTYNSFRSCIKLRARVFYAIFPWNIPEVQLCAPTITRNQLIPLCISLVHMTRVGTNDIRRRQEIFFLTFPQSWQEIPWFSFYFESFFALQHKHQLKTYLAD